MIDKIRNKSHLIETDAAIPIVIAPVDSSKGDLTGLRKRTIDRAPTIPKDNAMLPEMTLVKGGNIIIVAV